jgi:predicted PurR-regulated permease PerM
MARSDGSPPGLSLLVPLATILLVIATLHYARDVLVPMCLAILLTFIFSPVVTWLEKVRLRRVPSAVIVIILFVTGASALSWVVARQLVNVAVQLPEYKANLERKLQTRPGEPPGKLAALLESFREIDSNPLETAQSGNASVAKPDSPSRKNAPTVVVETEPFSLLSTLHGSILAPIVTIGAVIVFTVFMLADRELLRNKILRLAGRGHLTTTTRALDEAAHRVSRYLLFQSLVNIAYGTIVAVGLHLLGIPNALVWGVLSGLLRYVPYLGAIVATSLPSLVAFGAFADWHRVLYVFAFFLGIEIVTANFVEPYIYGSQTGISALAILVAAIFWSLIWGPVGLLLSTPLTVCLVAFGKHVPHLEFLTILLGDEPALPPHVKVYQRLLADDADEALAIAKGYLEQNSIEDLYDSVLVPVLAMTEHDRRRGALADNQEAVVLDNFKELLEDLDGRANGTSNGGSSGLYSERFASQDGHSAVLAVPVRNEADEIGATLLSDLAQRCQSGVDVLRPTPLKEALEQIATAAPRLVCISSVPPFSLRYTRALYKTLKHLHPDTNVIVGIWTFEGPTTSLQERIGVAEPDKIATTLSDAAKQIQEFTKQSCQR